MTSASFSEKHIVDVFRPSEKIGLKQQTVGKELWSTSTVEMMKQGRSWRKSSICQRFSATESHLSAVTFQFPLMTFIQFAFCLLVCFWLMDQNMSDGLFIHICVRI